MSIYLTSDLHFGHNKTFLYEPRGFASAAEMDEAIIHNWNRLITDNDEVYVLGDMMLSDDVNGIKCIVSLNGRIHIIRGNHDSDRRIELYQHCFNVLDVQNSAYLHYNGLHFYLTHYPTLTSNFDYDKPLKARLLNLCGHTHTPEIFGDWDRYNAPIYHCELDAHNCYPISLNQIIADIYAHENSKA